MKALIAKELRALLPIICLWGGILIIGHFVDLIGSRPDEALLLKFCDALCETGISPAWVIYAAFGLVTAYALFPREQIDGTIDFLHALPVSRPAIFWGKVIAAMLVLIGFLLLGTVLEHLTLSFNPDSLSAGHYWNIVGKLLVRDAIALFVIVCWGVFLSWFRMLGLFLFAGYFALVMILETKWKISGAWNMAEMFRVAYDGQSLLLPYAALAIHSGIGLLVLFAAYQLWGGSESRFGAGTGAPAWLRSLGLTLLFVFFGVVLLGTHTYQTGEQSEIKIQQTRYYRFSYKRSIEQRADEVLRGADSLYEAIADQMGIEHDRRPKIVADMTGATEHFAGQATWKTLRMRLNSIQPVDYSRYVLAHETAHVLQSTESNRRMNRHAGSMRFFVEGSAEYLAAKVVQRPDREKSWYTASQAASRLKIDFFDLVDDTQFRARFNPRLYYPVGEIWATALVESCGGAAIGNVFRAIARDGAPSSLSGSALWQDTLHAFGCSLADVNSRFNELMRAAGDRQSAAVDLPEFGAATVSPQDGVIRLLARLAPASGVGRWQGRFMLTVRLQQALAAEPDPVLSGRFQPDDAGGSVRFLIPARYLPPSGRLTYQLAYQPTGLNSGVYERWRTVTVSEK